MVINTAEFFLSHRLPVAQAARDVGFDVHIATALTPAAQEIRNHGFAYHGLDLTRSGQRLSQELRSWVQLFYLMRQLRPDVVHLVTIKPVLYGGLAARWLGVPNVIAAISGLGHVFTAEGVWPRVRRVIVRWMYRLALRSWRVRVIVQNDADRELLIKWNVVTGDQVTLIQGSGVDLKKFVFVPEPDGTPVVAMAARLLSDKGVREFVEAARLLRGQGVSVQFILAGTPDPGNPTSITLDEVRSWISEGVVDYVGYVAEMSEWLRKVNVVVLPSYREGLPKVLIEAAAAGRPVVTTDQPGCRDAVRPGESGLLVPIKNPQALAEAIKRLVEDPNLRATMGIAARRDAEARFSIEQVIRQHLALYERPRAREVNP